MGYLTFPVSRICTNDYFMVNGLQKTILWKCYFIIFVIFIIPTFFDRKIILTLSDIFYICLKKW